MIKLRVQFELAYEIIFTSMIVIFIGLAFLFASNLLILNWYSVAFGIIALLLFFFKTQSYIRIQDNHLKVVVGKYITVNTIRMEEVSEIIFYKNKRLIEFKSNNQTDVTIYLKMKNKEKLLRYIISVYPEIPCLFI